jgi:hypothetical protein
VPDDHAPAREAVGDRRENRPLYPIGSSLPYAVGFCGVTIGLVRRMLATYVDLARVRHARFSINAMADNNAVQREVGLLEARLSPARTFLHEPVGRDGRVRPMTRNSRGTQQPVICGTHVFLDHVQACSVANKCHQNP